MARREPSRRLRVTQTKPNKQRQRQTQTFVESDKHRDTHATHPNNHPPTTIRRYRQSHLNNTRHPNKQSSKRSPHTYYTTHQQTSAHVLLTATHAHTSTNNTHRRHRAFSRRSPFFTCSQIGGKETLQADCLGVNEVSLRGRVSGVAAHYPSFGVGSDVRDKHGIFKVSPCFILAPHLKLLVGTAADAYAVKQRSVWWSSPSSKGEPRSGKHTMCAELHLSKTSLKNHTDQANQPSAHC